MSKKNGKAEELVEYAEIIMDDELANEIRELNNEVLLNNQRYASLEQAQAQAVQQMMEIIGASKAIIEIRNKKVQKFAEKNNIDVGEWKFDIDEGKFIKTTS